MVSDGDWGRRSVNVIVVRVGGAGGGRVEVDGGQMRVAEDGEAVAV